MHEILTLQLGQRSNYLATHFWNTQESYFTYSAEEESLVDHDIHFRPGIGADGTETYTPRTVIYDLKGGFGTLRKVNALYELEEDRAASAGVWTGAPTMRPQPVIEQSAYQLALESGTEPPPLSKESVRYWSDFNRVYFHPRSIVQLNEYELNSSLMPFENWSTGEDLFDTLDKEHDLLDRDLRPFAEEADQLQGIQIMASIDDAWGGFAAKYIDRLRDEYGKTALWVWGLEDRLANTPRNKQFLKMSNTARSISEVSSQASVFIPLTFPSKPLPSYMSIDSQSPWHVSALFSTAMESITLPSRLRSNNGKRESLDDLAAALNVNGNQNIAKLQMSIENEPQENGDDRTGRLDLPSMGRDIRIPSQNGHEYDEDEAEPELLSLDMEFFPSEETTLVRGRRSNKRTHIFGQVEVFRNNKDPKDQDENGVYADGYERARRRAAGLPIIHRSRIPLPYSLLDSFPHIYDSMSSPLSMHTALLTDSGVALRIKNLRSIVSRSMPLEEREALSNTLGEIAEAYEEGWDSGSDEDDD